MTQNETYPGMDGVSDRSGVYKLPTVRMSNRHIRLTNPRMKGPKQVNSRNAVATECGVREDE